MLSSINSLPFGLKLYEMMLRIALFLLLVFANHGLKAQFHAVHSNEIPVIKNGDNLANAWAGGINAGQISRIDANQDGLMDIFVFDRSGNKVLVFLNNDSGDPNTFPYSLEHSQAFPTLRDWALLRDFDCDGKRDIFTYNGIGGFKIFKNISTPTDGLQFEEVESNLQAFFNLANDSYNSNIYISSVDLPAVDDLDGDGDLDIMVYSIFGTQVEYHKNMSMENYGTCDSLEYRAANRCYGYFSESAFDNSINLHNEETHASHCPLGYNVLNPSPIVGHPATHPITLHQNSNLRHAGTTLLTLEMTGELPKEIVLGDVSHHNLTALTNSKTVTGMDSVIAVDIEFPANYSNTEAVNLASFPASFYEDMNDDGVRDLIVCPNSAWTSENSESVWYYQNIGEDDNPNFILQQKDLFQKEMIDVGEGATTFFLDYNQDGLPDMLVGNKGYFLELGTYKSALALYENTGTAAEPEFTHITYDFSGLGEMNLGQALHPAFGDIDGDGDLDMLLGTSSGTVYHFVNTAGPGNPVNFEIAPTPILKDSDGNSIDPGQFSTPQLIDLTGNGLLDLVMGERNGKIHLYENSGSTTNPSFSLINEFLGGVETTEGFASTGYSNIYFFDHDGERYLMTGAESGKIRLYSNITGNLNGTFTLENDQLFGLKNGMRSTVSVIDINSDGYPDFFTGNFGGGILFFRGSEPVGLNSFSREDKSLALYPNPAIEMVNVSCLTLEKCTPYRVKIYSSLGVGVLSADKLATQHKINIAALPVGVYVLQALNAQNEIVGTHKLIKQ